MDLGSVQSSRKVTLRLTAAMTPMAKGIEVSPGISGICLCKSGLSRHIGNCWELTYRTDTYILMYCLSIFTVGFSEYFKYLFIRSDVF